MTESMSLSSPERDLDGLDIDHVRELLGEDSPLRTSTALPAFEYRRSQQDMAVAVAEVFRDGGELLVEAGTGTGKTLAYLIPAVLSGQRVVVSTGTKNLQEQLFYKDIPLLRKAMKVPFTACLMKGRGNYLCLTRHAQFAMQPSFRIFQEASHFDAVERWAGITKTGDRAEIPGVPDRLDFWKGISARSENCAGRDCSEFERCYVTKIRQRAAESDIIIVNHHLLFADLMVREGSYGAVLPDYDYLILDESHQIEDVATQYFGLVVSNVRVEELVRDCDEAWRTRAGAERVSRAQLQLRRLRSSGQELFESFRGRDERYRLKPKAMTPAQERLHDGFVKELAKVRSELSGIPNPDEATVALSRRSSEIELDLVSILAASDPDAVSWCEQRERSVALHSSPIQVASFLKASLFERKHAVVMTSATLTVDDSFEYMGSRLGVATESCTTLASPFDYGEQALLYIARHLPPPREKAFMDEAIAEIRSLLDASHGRAFVLFTSFQNLRATKRAFEGNLPYPLLVHGDAPRGELLERFRETPGAVLLGTSSFWEGVDVMGEQLSCVIVDKLPFAVPGDPLVSARIDLVASTGGNGFADYQVPMAILSLKQGFGRLIRSKSDRGVVAILDSRVANKGYGRRFLSSLPPYRLTYDRRDVVRFFEAPRAPSA